MYHLDLEIFFLFFFPFFISFSPSKKTTYSLCNHTSLHLEHFRCNYKLEKNKVSHKIYVYRIEKLISNAIMNKEHENDAAKIKEDNVMLTLYI